MIGHRRLFRLLVSFRDPEFLHEVVAHLKIQIIILELLFSFPKYARDTLFQRVSLGTSISFETYLNTRYRDYSVIKDWIKWFSNPKPNLEVVHFPQKDVDGHRLRPFHPTAGLVDVENALESGKWSVIFAPSSELICDLSTRNSMNPGNVKE